MGGLGENPRAGRSITVLPAGGQAVVRVVCGAGLLFVSLCFPGPADNATLARREVRQKAGATTLADCRKLTAFFKKRTVSLSYLGGLDTVANSPAGLQNLDLLFPRELPTGPIRSVGVTGSVKVLAVAFEKGEIAERHLGLEIEEALQKALRIGGPGLKDGPSNQVAAHPHSLSQSEYGAPKTRHQQGGEHQWEI